jgi:hypothetical protein
MKRRRVSSQARRRRNLNKAKKDAKRFAESAASFVPGIGTVLGVRNLYKDGGKLIQSGSKVLRDFSKDW